MKSKSQHERASEILGLVLDLPRTQAFLKIDQLCEGNEELKNQVLKLYESIQDSEETSRQTPTINRIGSDNFSKKIFGRWTEVLVRNKRNRLIFFASIFILVAVSGFLIRQEFKQRIIKYETDKLSTQIHTQSLALLQWIEREKKIAQQLANSPEVVSLSTDINSILIDETGLLNVSDSNQVKEIVSRLVGIRSGFNLEGISILHPQDPTILITSLVNETGEPRTGINLEVAGKYYEQIDKAKQSGEIAYLSPLRDNERILDLPKELRKGSSFSFFAPIKNNSSLLGYLIVEYVLANQFSEIISRSDHDESNKIYAFDLVGRFLSTPRFEELLQSTYVLDFDSTKSAIQNAYIKNPGAELEPGETNPAVDTLQQNFTIILDSTYLDILSKNSRLSGQIMTPYQDFRGVEVVGMWRVFPDYEFGLLAEEDAATTYLSLDYFDTISWLFLGVLATLLAVLYKLNLNILSYGDRIEQLQELGRYHLDEKLGEGGFGQVYKGFHNNLKSAVAIKLLKKELNETDALDRFEQEVKLTAKLTNPHTIKVYDYGKTTEGQFYYVMEYLNGLTLEKAVAGQEVFPIGRCIHVLIQVSYSLREAHAQNLIHRDIKPANIMLCNQGGQFDFVKLLDFGLVKNINTSMSQQTEINRIGGTPMFMAPERLRDPFNADQRVDIYALGAVGVYMLSGQFIVELISKKMLHEEGKMSDKLRDSLIERDDVPDKLLSLFLNCLQYEAKNRPANVEQVLDELIAIQMDYPWTMADAKNWWKSYDVYGVN